MLGEIRLRGLVVLVLVLLTAAPADAAVRWERAGRFSEPVFVTSVDGRAAVVQRRGLIRDVASRRVLVDLRSRVLQPTEGELVDQRGLFSAVWRDGVWYVEYVDQSSRLRVDSVRGGVVQPLLDFGEVGLRHHGGQLALGPDGMLFASVPGQIVRFRPGEPATVVVDGLRNPWRFSFFRGALLVADVGESNTETVSLYPPGKPALVLRHPRFCAVIGGYVWHGRYWYGDLCSGDVWSARVSGTSFVRPRREGRVNYLVSFGLVRDQLYAVGFAGSVWRLRPG